MFHSRILITLIALCFGCAQGVPLTIIAQETETPDVEDNTYLEECSVAFDPSPEVYDYVLSAVQRWSAATGCDIHISDDGIAVSMVDQILTPDGRKARGVTHCSGGEVEYINIAVYSKAPAVTVAHEIGHAIADQCGSDQHHAESGILMESSPDNVIDEASLTMVCQGLPCKEFTPEE